MTATHFADRWFDALERKGSPVCVGLDPVWDKLPEEFRGGGAPQNGGSLAGRASVIASFCAEIIRLVEPHVPCVKVNIAFFEPYQDAGIRAFLDTVATARRAGLIVIGDIKRGDIGHTADSYAAAHLDESCQPQGTLLADAVTINPYFGADGVDPFLRRAAALGKGVFVLAQTSNASAGQVQGLRLADGREVRDAVAELIAAWSKSIGPPGASGYGLVGAVVSPTNVEATRRLRAAMPGSLFLVPGFGAQGRTADEALACFDDRGQGAIVTSSRGVMFAYDDARFRPAGASDWRASVTEAAIAFARDVREAIQAGRR